MTEWQAPITGTINAAYQGLHQHETEIKARAECWCLLG